MRSDEMPRLLPLFLIISACAIDSAPPPNRSSVDANPAPERYVDIVLVDAMIGPAKVSGKPWDGFTPPSTETIERVALNDGVGSVRGGSW